MRGSCRTSFFNFHPIGIHLHQNARGRYRAALSSAAPACRFQQCLKLRVGRLQGQLAPQCRFEAVSQSKPFLDGCRLKAAKGADGTLAWTFGRVNGFDEDVVGGKR